ncbi:MAG: diguanylate cyclase [Rhodospirillaceae bacterium]
MPWRLSPYVHCHRAALIISRTQVVAALFAVLVPAWILVDMLALEHWMWLSIMPLRIVACIIFACLAWPRKVNDTVSFSRIILAGLVLLPPMFYLLSALIIADAGKTGFTGFVRDLYQYLPFTVVAVLCIFPLTALEVLGCWLVVFVVMVGGERIFFERDWVSLAGPLWLLMLIGGTAMVSGMSQLQYMIALVRRVTFDTLTGALTRRAGLEMLEAQFRHGLQSESPLTLAFVDVDRFKQVNDGFGHECGDQVLRKVVQQFQRGLRQGDAVIRWGGEEFLIVLSGTDVHGALLVIERLGTGGFGARPDGQPVTVSIGLAERLTDVIKGSHELIELADRRMYEAKLGGRNRVVFGGGALPVVALAS